MTLVVSILRLGFARPVLFGLEAANVSDWSIYNEISYRVERDLATAVCRVQDVTRRIELAQKNEEEH